MLEKIQQTTTFLRNKFTTIPQIAIVLGSGLGDLALQITEKTQIPYAEIPNFPVSTVEGHAGNLIVGKLGSKLILAMQGRFHFYEGYDMKQVTFPIRVMASLGIKTVCLSNAAGGVNTTFCPGDLMMITDHINLFPEHPLRGKNFSELGTRFPDMSEAYDRALMAKAREIATANHISLKEGVYVGSQGPTFETPAEYRFFRTIGGDAVGMSTVPEVIVANHAGLRCFAISVITNVGGMPETTKASHEEVQEASRLAQPRMCTIIKGLVESL